VLVLGLGFVLEVWPWEKKNQGQNMVDYKIRH